MDYSRESEENKKGEGEYFLFHNIEELEISYGKLYGFSLQNQIFYRSVALSMNGNRSMYLEAMCMKSRPIALVLLETIVYKLFCIFSHRTVTRHFGDDRSGLDFFDETISSDDIFDRFGIDATESIIIPPVDLDTIDLICRDPIYRVSTLLQCLLHRESIRLSDTDPVNDGRVDDTDSVDNFSSFCRRDNLLK